MMRLEDLKKRIAKLEQPFQPHIEIWPPQSGLAKCYYDSMDEETRSRFKSRREIYNYMAEEAFRDENNLKNSDK